MIQYYCLDVILFLLAISVSSLYLSGLLLRTCRRGNRIKNKMD